MGFQQRRAFPYPCDLIELDLASDPSPHNCGGNLTDLGEISRAGA